MNDRGAPVGAGALEIRTRAGRCPTGLALD
jgi:hypothetical protein